MKTTILTDRFEASHGKKPRGFGSWAFELRSRRADGSADVVLWVHGKTWGEAKKEAEKSGHGLLFVCP